LIMKERYTLPLVINIMFKSSLLMVKLILIHTIIQLVTLIILMVLLLMMKDISLYQFIMVVLLFFMY
uniref:Uncharacterized protein n=1 Tax=Amphimedon queenslandica TaxID=400682 RepID=A0A1X7UB85_AMPQE